MNILVIFAIIIVVFAYIKLYMKPKNHLELLQVNLSNFNSSMLIEKQPILIFDKVVHPQHVIDIFFKYMYHLSNSTKTKGEYVQNLSKFAVIHNDTDEVQQISIQKYKSKTTSSSKNMFFSTIEHHKAIETINIKLPEKNILIIPYLFSIKTDQSIPITYLSDFIHVFF